MNLLLDHLPLLLVLVPLGGALTLGLQHLAGVSGPGTSTAKWSALFSVSLSLVLAVAMVGHYSPDLRRPNGRPITTQMATSVTWIGQSPPNVATSPAAVLSSSGTELESDSDALPEPSSAAEAVPRRSGPLIRLAFAADGITLWLIALVPLLTLGVWLAIRRDEATSTADLIGLLLVQGCATAVFATRDAAVLVFAAGALSVSLAILAGLFDRLPERREAARRILIGHSLSDLMLLVSVCGLAGTMMRMETIGREAFSIGTFDLDTLTFGTAFLSGHDPHQLVWRPMEGWLFTGFVFAIALRVPLFPFHRRVAVSVSDLRPGVRGLACVLPLMVGSYLAIRLLIPLFPTLLAMHGIWLSGLLLVGVWGTALSASRETDPRRAIAFLAVAAGSTIGIGAVTLSPTGLLGAVLLLVAAAVGLFLLAAASERSDGIAAADSRSLLAGFVLAILPGLWVFWLGVSRNVSQLPGRLLLGPFLLITPLAIAGLSLSRWRNQLAVPQSVEESRGRWLIAGALLLIGCGVLAPVILNRSEPTVARYLRIDLPQKESAAAGVRTLEDGNRLSRSIDVRALP